MDLTTPPGATLTWGATNEETSTKTKKAWKLYFCGYILDRARYKAEAQARFYFPDETRFLFEANLGR